MNISGVEQNADMGCGNWSKDPYFTFRDNLGPNRQRHQTAARNP
ncbi:hypothetical protein DESC_480161 [Desulfosarcina cetonica]|nr:hypothetical protein DESC_480161 [Desulfosarcina cetonica]